MAQIGTQLRNKILGQSPTCFWCGFAGQASFDVDHLLPRSQGGNEDPTNLVAACVSCNRSRQDRPASMANEWVSRSRFLRQTPQERMDAALAVMVAVASQRRAS